VLVITKNNPGYLFPEIIVLLFITDQPVTMLPVTESPKDETNYTAVGMIVGGLVGAMAIGTVLAVMQRGKKTVDEQLSKRKKSKRRKSKKKKQQKRQASILDLANYM